MGVVAVEYTMNTERQPYPTDVTDDEWAFVAPNASAGTRK